MSNFARVLLVAMSPLAAAVLVACGGGGGGADAPGVPFAPVSVTPPVVAAPVTPPSSSGAVVSGGSDVAAGLTEVEQTTTSAITAIKSSLNRSGVTIVTPLGNLSSISIAHTSVKYTIQTNGLATQGFFTTTSGPNRVFVGGTTWQYARFGIVEQDYLPSSATSSNFKRTSAPFWAAQIYSSGPKVAANYNVDGLLVGRLVIDQSSFQIAQCQVAIQVSYTDNTESATLNLTNCIVNGATTPISISGSLKVDTSSPNKLITASDAAGFSMVLAGETPTTFKLLSADRPSGSFVVAGPNREQIVGTGQIAGTAMVNGVSQNALFTFAYGAKKS